MTPPTATPVDSSPVAGLPEQACELAGALLRDSQQRESRADRAHDRQMAEMLEDTNGKAFTIALADQVMRFAQPARAARRFQSILKRLGVPRYLGPIDQALLSIAGVASRYFPRIVMAQVAAQVRRESSSVILNGESAKLRRYMRRTTAAGTRVNVNQLGEAVLGEDEAQRRLQAVAARLADPEIACVSVKISAIYSQIHLVAYQQTLDDIKIRLRTLYRAAQTHTTSTGSAKFINLDMEEYRDLHLTVDAFRSVLDESEFLSLEAGIVLQAYLPDSFAVLKMLTAWAQRRVEKGGAGIKIRLVKGANLAMESVEAVLHGWEQAPYGSKLEVDANFKRMLHFACEPANATFVRIGVASHNLFDIAYALLLREQNSVADRVEFEMLEGMANAQAAVVQQRAHGLLTYAPVVQPEHFQSAIAYLVRRLEENTTPGNFLRDLFSLREGSDAWQLQRSSFLDACARATSLELACTPNRTQDRVTECAAPTAAAAGPFQNAADTDFALSRNRQWISAHLDQWSSPDPDLCVMGDAAAVDHALETAVNAQRVWEDLGVAGRAAILRKAAAVIARHRGETIACMLHDADKAVMEGDVEVSEAIDFANYYAAAFDGSEWSDGVQSKAIGVVLVTPPWNFPYAIPAGGCLAALMAGNSVILKPATETILTARMAAEHLWEAGVPRDVLQFLTVPDNEIGQKLVTDDRVAAVILTGAFETARMFQKWKPALRLSAETSGKNSLIITQAADLDLAVKDLVKGAFGHAGQKCSATSLALVEAAVYDDPAFPRQLKDAAESLHVGTADDLSSIVTPLILEPGESLKRALTTLEPGEEWLLQPQMIDGNARLWSPGIKLGVVPGSWFHKTECFGPVLGIVRVRDLAQAIEVQNAYALGLTGGIHSLDEEETRRWEAAVEVGNAYINRSTTGAIVQRQPFGGWKQSCIGPGAKAGGPNYVASFVQWTDLPTAPMHAAKLTPEQQSAVDDFAGHLNPNEVEALQASAESFHYWWQSHFSIEHDPTGLICERNVFRYRPRKNVIVRIEQSNTSLPLSQIHVASRLCGVPLEISAATPINGFDVCVESLDELGGRLSTSGASLLRTDLETVDPRLLEAAHGAHIHVSNASVVANGRIELLHYLHEQSISETRHRYGNILE